MLARDSAGDKPHLIMSGIGKPDWFYTIFGRIQFQESGDIKEHKV